MTASVFQVSAEHSEHHVTIPLGIQKFHSAPGAQEQLFKDRVLLVACCLLGGAAVSLL